MSEIELAHVVVAGGAGFIGSAFARTYLARHPAARVTVLDKLTYAGNPRNLDPVRDDPRFAFVQADIADLDIVENVMREHEIDTVVNFAAESHNSLAVVDPGRFFHTNVVGTQALLEASRRVEVVYITNLSSASTRAQLGHSPRARSMNQPFFTPQSTGLAVTVRTCWPGVQTVRGEPVGHSCSTRVCCTKLLPLWRGVARVVESSLSFTAYMVCWRVSVRSVWPR